jgi:hypothetical protein
VKRALAFGLPLALIAAVAMGARPLGETSLISMLNGHPLLLGVISSTDGGVFTNLTTDLPDGGKTADGGAGAGSFTIGVGDMLLLQFACGHYARIGDTGINKYTDLTFDADEKFYTLLDMSDAGVIAVQAESTVCTPGVKVFKMR